MKFDRNWNNIGLAGCIIVVLVLGLVCFRAVTIIDSEPRQFMEASQMAAKSYVSQRLEGNWALEFSREENGHVFHTFIQTHPASASNTPGAFITLVMSRKHEVIRVSGGL